MLPGDERPVPDPGHQYGIEDRATYEQVQTGAG